jgi:hypothetical protein
MENSRAARLLVGAAAAALLLPLGVTWAEADQVKYVGVHPAAGGGFCYIEAPHVHIYKPHKSKKKIKLLYRVHDGHYHFVGDPIGHGYEGPRHAYYGHHPIAVDVVAGVHVDGAPHHVEFCYLDGPHYHWYAPPADLEFTVKGDAYWYVGVYPPRYKKHRKVLVGINAVYRPIRYTRPVIEVEPPAAYVGPIVEVHAPVVEAGVVPARVHGPVVHGEVRAGVEVVVPAPTLEVGVSLPGVVVVEEHHHPPGRKVGWYKHKKYKHKKYKHKRKYKRKGKYKSKVKYKRKRKRH